MSLWEGLRSDRCLQRAEERGAMINQWGPDQVHTNNSQRNPARSDFLSAITPPSWFTTSPNAHRIYHDRETMTNGGSRPKRFHQRLCVTWSEPLFGQTSLVNARVSLVPCNWYNVKKQFRDRPEKTYGPCLWSESVWCIHEGEQLHPVIKAER